MSFPKPIKPPSAVKKARQSRLKDLITASTLGILFRAVIMIVEVYGFLAFGSYALLFDALATMVDIVSTTVLIFSMQVAARPPDKNHPFGHGRLEPLVGLQLGLLLIISGVVLFAAQILRGYEVSDYHPNRWLWIIPALAFLALEFATRYIEAAAKRQNSPALSADAKHFRVDAISSLIAALALGIGSIFPPVAILFDHFGALLIALFMIYLGIKASRENLEQILDQTPDEEYFEFVRMAARSVKGVLGVEKVKIQRYGPDAHVDIDIEVDPKMDVESSHRITQLVTSEIKKGWPEVQDVLVHVEPYYPGDH